MNEPDVVKVGWGPRWLPGQSRRIAEARSRADELVDDIESSGVLSERFTRREDADAPAPDRIRPHRAQPEEIAALIEALLQPPVDARKIEILVAIRDNEARAGEPNAEIIELLDEALQRFVPSAHQPRHAQTAES
jgi:hypothetical protein